MRCLSVRSPWGWAIVWAGKSPENRTWSTNYRGPVGIHQGKTPAMLVEMTPAVAAAEEAFVARPTEGEEGYDCAASWEARGAVIGLAELVDCHPDTGCCRPWGESSFTSAGGQLCRSVYHWVLEDAHPIGPIPTLGRQGLWTPDPDLLAEIALAEAST